MRRTLLSHALGRLVSLVPVVLGSACGGADATTPPAVAPAPPTPAATAAADPSRDARARFENPGGMWMPEQMVEHAETLKSLGVELDPAAMANPSSSLLQAVVSLGGCSASFVSPEGLLATNHHCVIGALQYNSTPTDNLLENGHLARDRAQEKWNGPTARVYVTQSLKDVTKEVREGLDGIRDDKARTKRIEQRSKELTAACEKGRPGIRCSVAAYFGGGAYRLIEQLEIRDVRLVFAPHAGVGNFGGEVDNWRWPRHTGDVALLRAYVGKDGKPADYSESNVPYKPAHHLQIAQKPLRERDFVMVAGYPGATNRLRTAAEVDYALAVTYPRRISYAEQNVAVLEALGKAEGADVALKATPIIRNLNNGLTKYRGIVEGMSKGGVAADKAKAESAMRAWVESDGARKKEFGDVLDKMATLVAERAKTRDQDDALAEVERGLLGSAKVLVRMAEERPKADADRDPNYQERNWSRIEGAEAAADKRYDRRIDRAMLKLALERAAGSAGASGTASATNPATALLGAILGPGPVTADKIDRALDALYKGTKLEELSTRTKLLKEASIADLKKSKDTMVQLALKLRPLSKQAEDRDDAYTGALVMLRPRYVAMVKAWTKAPVAPDANSTLRVTYGTVRGYTPPGGSAYRPFTTLTEMVSRSTGNEPFHTPAMVRDAARAKNVMPYVDAELGDVPVNFLSDLDITGGNSGSATLNARGELVGLAFDGNYESMASDWVVLPSVTRTIHVDARYILWLLDKAYSAESLLTEMGVRRAAN